MKHVLYMLVGCLSAHAFAAIVGPMRIEGKVIEIKSKTILILTEDGKKAEVGRETIPSVSSLKAGDHVVSMITAEDAQAKLKKQAAEKPKK